MSDARPEVRVLIVEDDPDLREHLADVIGSIEGACVVGRAGSVAAGAALLGPHVNVVLLDVALPDGSGLELLSQARAAGLPCKVLVVSGLGDAETVVQALRRGADGYFLKGDSAAHAEASIRLVMAGGSPISPSVAGHILALLREPSPSTGAAPRPAAPPALTPREIELLQSLSKGLSYKELAAIHGISAHTVAVHVKSIYRKLEVASRGEAVFEAVQLGLIRMD